MNLSTRRLTEAELTHWLDSPARRLWTISVADRFGDAGLTGIVSVEIANGDARIVDFVVSCRVIGRKVEETLVYIAVEHARNRGAGRVVADLLRTSKNQPCVAFWEGSGFARGGDRFEWNVASVFPLPETIALEWKH
jgi:FkbH-like protein